MKWARVAVTTSAEAAEAVAHRFETLGAGGAVIEDPGLLSRRERESPLDYFDGTAVGPDTFQVVAYWPLDGELDGRLALLHDFLGKLGGFGLDPGPATVSVTDCDEEDWASAWKIHYRPQRFGRIVICPSWESCETVAGEVVVWLDPGMAFGTGNHPSTALCLRALSRHTKAGQTVLDVGTGSGILAVAAAKLGATRVLAMDVDPQAARVAAENASRNGVADRVRAVAGDARILLAEAVPADVVVANIVADVIIELGPALSVATRPGGRLVTAGIVASRADEVAHSLEAYGVALMDQTDEDGWVCLEFRKEAF